MNNRPTISNLFEFILMSAEQVFVFHLESVNDLKEVIQEYPEYPHKWFARLTDYDIEHEQHTIVLKDAFKHLFMKINLGEKNHDIIPLLKLCMHRFIQYHSSFIDVSDVIGEYYSIHRNPDDLKTDDPVDTSKEPFMRLKDI